VKKKNSVRGQSFALGLLMLGAAVAHAGPAAVHDNRGAHSRFPAADCAEPTPGVSIHMDNDLFAGGPHDADYTGGLALYLTPKNQSSGYLPHRLHFALDRLLGMKADSCRRHVWQFGLFSLTPGTLRSNVPVLDDRPFATVTLVGTTATWNTDRENVAMQSTLQVGALGWGLAETVHSALHHLVGDERPQGYQYQISAGGEPTLRYELARHRLLHETLARGETLQFKNTAAVSLGYLTETSVGFSARWGRIDSPWQSFTPELSSGYLPTVAPLVAPAGGRELYLFAGAQAKLRVYNALAQGQFRESVHVLRASELERLIGEAWLGVHWRPAEHWQLTYTFRVQSPELRHGAARRALVWGGLSMSRRY
jgi:hypothetical protein